MRLLANHSLTLAFVLGVPLTPARAQFTEARVGQRIRLEAPGIDPERYTGTVLRRTADSLVVGSPDAPPLDVALARITRVDVSRGASAVAGARRGFFVGAGVGAIGGALLHVSDVSGQGQGSLVVLVLPFVLAAEALLGGAVGAAIGAVVKREEWDSYTPTDTRVGVDEREGAMRIGVRRVF